MGARPNDVTIFSCGNVFWSMLNSNTGARRTEPAQIQTNKQAVTHSVKRQKNQKKPSGG